MLQIVVGEREGTKDPLMVDRMVGHKAQTRFLKIRAVSSNQMISGLSLSLQEHGDVGMVDMHYNTFVLEELFATWFNLPHILMTLFQIQFSDKQHLPFSRHPTTVSCGLSYAHTPTVDQPWVVWFG